MKAYITGLLTGVYVPLGEDRDGKPIPYARLGFKDYVIIALQTIGMLLGILVFMALVIGGVYWLSVSL